MGGLGGHTIRIYYGDGSIYDVTEEHPLAAAPPLNVQCIVHTDLTGDTGLLVTFNWDYYVVHSNGDVWGERGEVDFIEHVLHTDSIVKCFKARNVPHETFQTIMRAARAWAVEHGKTASRRRREDGGFYNAEQRR